MRYAELRLHNKANWADLNVGWFANHDVPVLDADVAPGDIEEEVDPAVHQSAVTAPGAVPGDYRVRVPLWICVVVVCMLC